MNWFNKYAERLGKRKDTFETMFKHLINQRKPFYTIVETGCMRDKNNFEGDGCSTFLFDEFVNYHEGMVSSVDLDEKAVELCSTYLSERTNVTHGDSLEFLAGLSEEEMGKIDLLYLDSMDLDVERPKVSAHHHALELNTIYNFLRRGCLIVVDDNFSKDCGKGMFVRQFLDEMGDKCLFDDYQIGYVKQ